MVGISQLREAIRQKTALVASMEKDLSKIRPTVEVDKERYVFLLLLKRYKSKIGADPAPVLSRKIDCIHYLLEN